MLFASTDAHTVLARLAKFLAFCVAGHSHCTLCAKFCVHACMTPVFSGRTKLLSFRHGRNRRSRNAFYATSRRFPRSSQEGNSDVPSEASLLPAVLTMNGGGFCYGKSPPSAGHISHPADGFAVGKCFCFPFLFEICVKLGAWQVARIFAFLLACVFCVRIFSSKCERKS